MRKLLVSLLLLGFLGVSLSVSAWGQSSESESSSALPPKPPKPPQDLIVARAGDIVVRRSDVLAYIDTLPDAIRQSSNPELLVRLVDSLLQRALFSAKAETLGLANKPEVQRLLHQAQQAILADVYLQEVVLKDSFSEADIKSEYDKYVRQNPPSQEARARHILLDSKAEAESLIGELQAGADFAELARLHSKGPSAANGGSLGSYFRHEEMVPAFSDAAFAMEVGAFSQAPVQSKFGWHIILLEDKRNTAPLPLEQLREQIQQALVLAKLDDAVAVLMQGVEVEYDGIRGEDVQSFIGGVN